jgi:SAM-dependent methyltransferase
MNKWNTTDWRQQNEEVWDERVRKKQAHTRTVRPEDLADPIKSIDPVGWLGGRVSGLRVLCLASGGGLQSILYARAGAEVTVLDISREMLQQDRELARELGLTIRTVHGSMDNLQIFGDRSFDLVVQPVSTCYVPDVVRVYAEVARVLQEGSLYIVQHKQPGSLQASAIPKNDHYIIEQPYYRAGPLPQPPGIFEHRESGAMEYLHRWEALIGGLCRQGFIIEDLLEPRHADPSASPGSFRHRSQFIPPYVLIKARRLSLSSTQSDGKSIIIP